MNAKQAKELTIKNLRGVCIAPALTQIYAKVEEAAKKGSSSISHPLDGVKPWPTSEQQEAIWEALTKEEYKVTHHPDPDPGHPCSSPYTTVSW